MANPCTLLEQAKLKRQEAKTLTEIASSLSLREHSQIVLNQAEQLEREALSLETAAAHLTSACASAGSP